MVRSRKELEIILKEILIQNEKLKLNNLNQNRRSYQKSTINRYNKSFDASDDISTNGDQIVG